MASSSSAELTRSYSTTGDAILNSTRARPGLRPIALSTPANGSLPMPNPAKEQKREEKVLAKLREICLGLLQAREVKTWRPTCRRSRVTKRRGAKARRQCRQGLWKCIRLSRTNREISVGTADSGTETEEARSMASRPSRDSPGQSLRIRIVGMSYILIVCEIDDRDERHVTSGRIHRGLDQPAFNITSSNISSKRTASFENRLA